jgi:hypothetical protein
VPVGWGHRGVKTVSLTVGTWACLLLSLVYRWSRGRARGDMPVQNTDWMFRNRVFTRIYRFKRLINKRACVRAWCQEATENCIMRVFMICRVLFA